MFEKAYSLWLTANSKKYFIDCELTAISCELFEEIIYGSQI